MFPCLVWFTLICDFWFYTIVNLETVKTNASMIVLLGASAVQQPVTACKNS